MRYADKGIQKLPLSTINIEEYANNNNTKNHVEEKQNDRNT